MTVAVAAPIISSYIVIVASSSSSSHNINTGKNPTYAQAIIKVFAHNTVYCVKLASCCFLLFTSELKIKNITMVDFNNKLLND